MGPKEGNTDDDHEFVIKTPPLDYEPNPRGMGYEYFHSMSKYHSRIAQIDAESGEEDTYGSLLKRSVRTALKMRDLGITPQDIVCLCTNNHLNSSVPFIAALFLGSKACSLDPSLSLSDSTHLLKLVEPTLVFVVPSAEKLITTALEDAGISSKIVVFGSTDDNMEFEEFLKEHPEEDTFEPVEVEDVMETAVILFSSGTTGLPKGICNHHYGLMSQSVNFLYEVDDREGAKLLVKYSFRKTGLVCSVSLAYSSLYWISAVCLLTSSIICGTARLICPTFDPEKAWTYIDKYKVSFLFSAPSQALDIYKVGRPENVDTTSLLVYIVGGAPISRNQLLRLRDLFPGTTVTQGYGQTEMAGVLTVFRANERQDEMFSLSKIESCGRIVPGFWVKVVDTDSEEILGPNQRGELRVKSKFLMNGYYKQDSSNTWDSNGWLKTGDVVYYDEDRYFYVVDRIKEMLKYRSWHVAPAALEMVIDQHPDVKTSVVVGIPHPEDGDHPCACVVLNEDAQTTPEEIVKFVEDRVDDRQRLRGGVKIIDSIPVTPTGKVRRKDLRDMVIRGEI